MFRRVFQPKRAFVALASFVAVIVMGGVVWAAFSVTGTGLAAGEVTEVVPLQLTEGNIPKKDTVFPGGTGDVVLAIRNKNSFAVEVSSLTQDGPITTSKQGCDPAWFTFTPPAGPWMVPAGTNRTVTLPDALALSPDATNECSKAKVSIPIVADGVQFIDPNATTTTTTEPQATTTTTTEPPPTTTTTITLPTEAACTWEYLGTDFEGNHQVALTWDNIGGFLVDLPYSVLAGGDGIQWQQGWNMTQDEPFSGTNPQVSFPQSSPGLDVPSETVLITWLGGTRFAVVPGGVSGGMDWFGHSGSTVMTFNSGGSNLVGPPSDFFMAFVDGGFGTFLLCEELGV